MPPKAISFDCYGTLIDWETGIWAAVAPFLSHTGLAVSPAELFAQYAELESQLEAPPYRSYREVLAGVMTGLAQELGFELGPGEENTLAKSLPSWPEFPEVPEVLAELAQSYPLAILSNVDRDLFAATQPKLGLEPGLVITAQDVRSYKPNLAHFQHALEALQIAPAELLHIAQSPFHDLVPAQSLGIKTVWVQRGPGFGPTRSSPSSAWRHITSLAGIFPLLAEFQ